MSKRIGAESLFGHLTLALRSDVDRRCSFQVLTPLNISLVSLPISSIVMS